MAESQELAQAAERAAVRVAIGLQTRASPAVRRAQELVRSGALGRILSARVVSTTAAFGPEVPSAMTYAEDPANGVTLLSIQGAHTLDRDRAAWRVLGSLGARGDAVSRDSGRRRRDARGTNDARSRARAVTAHERCHPRRRRGGWLSARRHAVPVRGLRRTEPARTRRRRATGLSVRAFTARGRRYVRTDGRRRDGRVAG